MRRGLVLRVSAKGGTQKGVMGVFLDGIEAERLAKRHQTEPELVRLLAEDTKISTTSMKDAVVDLAASERGVEWAYLYLLGKVIPQNPLVVAVENVVVFSRDPLRPVGFRFPPYYP